MAYQPFGLFNAKSCLHIDVCECVCVCVCVCGCVYVCVCKPIVCRSLYFQTSCLRSFVRKQLNGFQHCCLTLIILFENSPLFAQCKLVSSISIKPN